MAVPLISLGAKGLQHLYKIYRQGKKGVKGAKAGAKQARTNRASVANQVKAENARQAAGGGGTAALRGPGNQGFLPNGSKKMRAAMQQSAKDATRRKQELAAANVLGAGGGFASIYDTSPEAQAARRQAADNQRRAYYHQRLDDSPTGKREPAYDRQGSNFDPITPYGPFEDPQIEFDNYTPGMVVPGDGWGPGEPGVQDDVSSPATAAVVARGARPPGGGIRPPAGPPQQLDPFLGTPVGNPVGNPVAAAQEQELAQMAQIYNQARMAEEAAYKDRLNPFGIGSGYEDLQRPRGK